MLQDIRSETLSRRSFLVGTGAAGVAVGFGSLPDTAAAASPLAPNAWVTIGEDGIVTIVPPAVEMGQGAQTSLPLILAEELDADWSKVRLAPTPDNDKVYGNPAFRNQLTTVGSFAVTGYYETLRLVGAQARAVLLANAAEAWNVPAVDAGLAVQPKNIVAQIESAMTFGLGAALIEQITVSNGVVQQTNFHAYRVMRMSDMPLMDVKVISTDNKPTGIGEAGVPVVAPAIANAVAVLTGKRLRHLPMTPDRVKRGLA
jgi:CO/xanthine dehydrogenase Mo-binding subunit